MALYSQLDDRDFAEIRKTFALDCTRWRHMNGGANNTSYLFEGDTRSYVVTVLNEGDEVSQLELGQLLLFLDANGVDTAHPVRSVHGALVESVGLHRVMVKHFVEGVCHKELPREHLQAAGAALGRVHLVQPPDWLRPQARRIAQATLRLESIEDRAFATWAITQVERSGDALTIDAPRGLNHGDYFPDNVVIRSDGGITILDWATASEDLFLLDLGLALVGMSRLDNTFVAERAQTFLKGYEQVRRLTEAEREHMNDSIHYAAATLALHRYGLASANKDASEPILRYERMMAFSRTVPEGWRYDA